MAKNLKSLKKSTVFMTELEFITPLVKEERDVKEERVRRASTSHHHQLQSLLPTLHQGEPFHHYELFL